MARTKQTARAKKQTQKQKQEEKKAADAAKKAGVKAAKPRHPSEDPGMCSGLRMSSSTDSTEMISDEIEIQMEGHLCTVSFTMRKGCSKSVDVPNTYSVQSVVRDLAQLNGFKIADGEDAIRIVAEDEERSNPTFEDLEQYFYDADIRDDWETVNYVSVYYKPAPMTATDEKESAIRALVDNAHQTGISRSHGMSTTRLLGCKAYSETALLEKLRSSSGSNRATTAVTAG